MGREEAATSNVCSNAQEETVAIDKASFSKTEIIIQGPVKHLWPTYLSGIKSFLPRMIKEGVSGIQGNCFWPLLQRKYCKVEKPIKKTTVSELFVFEKHTNKFINIFRKCVCVHNTHIMYTTCTVYMCVYI